MEQADYVARAKALIQRTARTAALVIVPLAAAVSAGATTVATILPTSTVSCTVSNAGLSGSCSGGAAQITSDPGNGIFGVSLYTLGPVSFTGSGGGASGSSLKLQVNGALDGTINSGTIIPIHFDFSFDAFENWTLLFHMSDSSGSGGNFTTSGSGSGSMHGSGQITTSGFLYNGDVLSIFAQVSFDNTPVSVDVPTLSTFDFNSLNREIVQPEGTPEPAGFVLMAPGLALLGWKLRRRKSNAS